MKADTQSKLSKRYFRLVCSPLQQDSVEDLLRVEGFEQEKLIFYDLARQLQKAPFALGNSLAAYFGYLYIQDKSSMLPPLYLNPEPGAMVLDMCASPGSKTGILSQLVGPEGLIIANEPNPFRMQTLRQNLQQMNLSNVVTCQYKGQDLALEPESMPYILLDAPCSGWGTVDKNPQVIKIWKQGRLDSLLNLQRELLSKAARVLAYGGKLLYSTCTTNEQENEEQVNWVQKEFGLKLLDLKVKKDFFLFKSEKAKGSLRVLGQESDSQGFFMACLQKPGKQINKVQGPANRSIPGMHMDAPELENISEVNWSNLPAGRVRVFTKRLYFLPKQAYALLPEALHWQGFFLGHLRKESLCIHPRAQILLPAAQEKDNIIFSETKQIRKLLSGQSLTVQCTGKQIGLYWKDLPLGWLTVKKNRCLWSVPSS